MFQSPVQQTDNSEQAKLHLEIYIVRFRFGPNEACQVVVDTLQEKVWPQGRYPKEVPNHQNRRP